MFSFRRFFQKSTCKERRTQSNKQDEILNDVLPVALSVFPADENTEILINPSGCFNIGEPEADTGLTRRKIMADTYGGLAAHGGGAFFGKDATKVDRSGTYMARYIAKNLVAAGLADRCQAGISYAIGKAEPLAVSVESFGTSNFSDEEPAEPSAAGDGGRLCDRGGQ